MLRILIFASCWFVVGCGAVSKEPPQTRAKPAPALSLEEQAAEIVSALLPQYRVPGASVAMILDGEVTLVEGYGLRRAGETGAVDRRTVFQAASLSKPVVAYGVHVLVERGELDLDRPLSDYLDSPYLDDPRIDRITARIALSHSTGFPNWRPRHWTDDPGPLEIEFDPGTRFQYSGEGYGYLQRVVEQITGESLDVYLQRAVFDPLGMSDSSFVWQERFEAVHATPHDGEGRAQDKWRPRRAQAAGSLQTTAADYARFLQALLTESSDGSLPLGAAAVERMLTRHSTIEGDLGWSLGWGIESDQAGDVFWQWGDDGPVKALAAGSRSRRAAVVVFTNGQWGLDVARPLVEQALGPCDFLDFRMINYRP